LGVPSAGEPGFPGSPSLEGGWCVRRRVNVELPADG